MVSKHSSPRKQGLMIPFGTNVAKFEVFHIDYVGPIDEITERGNQYIFTMNDRGSGLVEAVPTTHATAIAAARAVWDKWIMRYGAPKVIISDRGAALVGNLFQTLAKVAKFDMAKTTAYHPRTNGKLEREHRSLKAYMKAYCMADPKRWDVLLPSFRLPMMSLDSQLTVDAVDGRVAEMLESMQAAFRVVREKQKGRDEKGRVQAKYLPGQVVWKFIEKSQLRGKFHLQWRGPYVIVEEK